jgi:drug/metabolite transporter (DMT)-like permease
MNLPILQNSIIYPLLLIVTLRNQKYCRQFTGYLIEEKQFGMTLLTGFLMGFCDVCGNIFIVKAFELTCSLSAVLISSLSTIFAVMFGYLMLGVTYKRMNVYGSLVCVVGLLFIISSKIIVENNRPDNTDVINGILHGSRVINHFGCGNHGLIGDFYALMAAFCYSLSNILNERLSKMESNYPIATLTAMGVFGTLISFFFIISPISAEDFKLLASIDHFDGKLIVLGFYPFVMFGFYVLVPTYLKLYSTILFNFHIVTADLYVFFYRLIFDPMEMPFVYWIGVLLVFMGLSIYALEEPTYPHDDYTPIPE